MKGLMMNPIIVMTILGLIANFIFGGQPPRILELLLSKLGAAFSSVAPFTLGLGMVGKFKGGLQIKKIGYKGQTNFPWP